jgi:hypothetical protein
VELVTHRFGKTKELLLMPVGDIQWAGDESEVALEMLKRHIAWGVKQGAWFIGMGDYIDTLSPSNRAKLSGAALYDTAVKALDRDAQARVKELYARALKPSRGRWLGLLEGHHFFQYRDQTTSDQELAKLLECPFLGSSAYVRLIFPRGYSTASQPTGTVTIWAHHGAGSSSAAGGAINRVERVMRSWDADIYLMGHHHKVGAQPMDYIRPVFPPHGAPHLMHATKMLVTTGSFLKGYIVGRTDGGIPRGGYVETAMMNPVQLGAPLIRIRPRWVGKNVWHPDFSAEV